MDPLTHTLTGATLAQTRLGRLGALPRRLATATLIVGANLPDVDVACYFVGSDFALAHRRGWTHGVLAMVLFPLLLAGAGLAWNRWRRSRRRPAAGPAPPVRFAPLLALAAVAVWSHPLLDWLNTYGLRLLAPFDWTWFYGDAVYIVDPWIWLALGGALFLAYSASRRAVAAWAVLGLLATLAVLAGVPEPARWVWLAGLGLLALLRWRRTVPRSRAAAERLGTAALAATALYAGLLAASGLAGRGLTLRSLAGPAELPVHDLMVGPEATDPFHRQVVVETREGYRLGRLSWLERPRVALEPRIRPKPELTPAVRAALEAPSVRGFVTWMRYPTVEVERTGGGITVHLIDLRYARRGTGGFGTARVELGARLRPQP